jgi:hypothetical protein
MKLDGAGAVAWRRVQASPFAGSPTSMAPMPDGGAIVVGSDPPWLWRLAPDGSLVRLEGIAAPGILRDPQVVASPDGGVHVVGELELPTGDRVAWVMHLDAAGAVLAQATVGIDYTNFANARVAATDDGGVFLAIGQIGGDWGIPDVVSLTRLDASMAVVWSETIEVEAGHLRLDDLAPRGNGVLLAGTTHRDPDLGGCGNEGALIGAVDAGGGLTWQRLLAPSAGEISIAATPGGAAMLLDGVALRTLDASGLMDADCRGLVDAPVLTLTATPPTLVATAATLAALPARDEIVATASAPTSTAVHSLGDLAEPNDACTSPAPLTDGAATAVDFCDDGIDWYELIACAGVTYDVATSGLGPLANTIVEVWPPDCSALLASDDDGGGGLASRLSWMAPSAGRYRICVRQADASSGADRGYSLRVSPVAGACPTWERAFRSTLECSYPWATALECLPDGTSVIGGEVGDALGEHALALVARLDASGMLIGDELFSGSRGGPSGGHRVDEVLALPGGGFAVAGRSPSDYDGQLFLRLHDASGAVTWESGLESPPRFDSTARLRSLGAGRLVVLGITKDYGAPPDGIWLLRLDATGAPEASVLLRDIRDVLDDAPDVVVMSDGGLLVASPQGSTSELVLVRLDAAWAPQWERQFDVDLGWGTAARLETASDGSIFVTAGDSVLKLDATGDPIWHRRLSGATPFAIWALAATPDGGCVAAGALEPPGGPAAPTAARLDAAGDITWQVAEIDPSAEGRFSDVSVAADGSLVLMTVGYPGTMLLRLGSDGRFDGCHALADPGLSSTPDTTAWNPGAFSVEPFATSVVSETFTLVGTALAPEATCTEVPGDGFDNDGDGLVDDDDPDTWRTDVDGDGVFPPNDCAPLDASVWSPPGEVTKLRVFKLAPDGSSVRLNWSSAAALAAGSELATYNPTSGRLADLRASGWPAHDTCLGRTTDLSVEDARPLIVADWYLVRFKNACGVGPWGALADPVPGCQ